MLQIIAKKKSYPRIEHIRTKRAFVREYKNWSIKQQKKIIWRDEASFELGNKASTQIKVWRTSDVAYERECLAPTFKTARSSVMVGGGISWGRKSELVILAKDKQTSKDFVQQVYDGYLEEGAPIHRAKVATNRREEHEVDKIVWLPQAPLDMNPIENL